jgi:histidinol phosphatase-like enzyme (inositol monophosphatase family)
MNELEDILDTAKDIAEEAAQLAFSYFRQPILIEMKENQTPVTVADKKTEEFIRKSLLEAFPGFGILGEELGEESTHQQYVWTVDPIDGTRSFVRGIPLFGTLIGLLDRGKPIGGIMVLPALEETYWAGSGMGAFCNDHQIHVSQASHLKASVIGVGDVYAFQEVRKEKLFYQLAEKTEICRGYTDCFGHSLVFRGTLDAMVDPVVSIWDIAPLACMVEEAGGQYFDFHGEKTIQSKNFITCGPGLRKEILSLI